MPNMAITAVPTTPSIRKYIITIISTGTIVSIVYLPRNVRTKSATGVILTESVRQTQMPNIFFPSVLPSPSTSGSANSSTANARRMDIDSIVIARFTTIPNVRTIPSSEFSAAAASSYFRRASSGSALYSSSVMSKLTPYFSSASAYAFSSSAACRSYPVTADRISATATASTANNIASNKNADARL